MRRTPIVRIMTNCHKSCSSKSTAKSIIIIMALILVTSSSSPNAQISPQDRTVHYFPYSKLDVFFIIGYIMIFTVTSILLYCAFAIINKQEQEQGFFYQLIRPATIFMAIWVNVAYIMTAVVDPGIYRPGEITISQPNNTLRNCLICRFNIPNNVRHCNICNVCILELDHHCPWMSKCVGKNNLRSFYAFIMGVFVMMGLFWLTIFMILTT